MKFIYVLPQTQAFELEVAKANLATLQALVGGTITGVKLNDLDGFVHDEGLLIGLTPNVYFSETDTFLAGPIVFTRTNEEGETIGVQPGDLEAVQAWLNESKRPGRFDYGYLACRESKRFPSPLLCRPKS